MGKFVHFRVQSSYSMLESALKIDQIVDLAEQNNMGSVCLADRGNLFGSLEFSLEACKKKIQPIHGSVLNIEFDSSGKQDRESQDFAEIVLIAKDQTGYRNLLKIVSKTFIDNDRAFNKYITFEDLKEYHEGLIITSAYAEGIIGKLLLTNSFDEALQAAAKFKELLGDRFYFEIMRQSYDRVHEIEADYLKIADDLGIPLLATNQVLFSNPEMHDAHDVLLCIAAGVVSEEQNRKRVSNQCYFKSAEEMIELFRDLPEAIENTIQLAKRCSVVAEAREACFPSFASGIEEEKNILRIQAKEGLEFRLNKKKDKIKARQLPEQEREEYFKRLEFELDIICNMNFAGYFLIVSDFIKWSKVKNIAVGPGRGSGAGSIIAWALQITELDPIEFGLLFERFLNPERVSIPDFDIDFCQERREEVISYVRSKYGDDRVAQIITFGKMQAKAVIKDVSRVLGLRYIFADYLTELVPFNAVNPVTLQQAIDDVAELNQAYKGKGLYNLEGEHELIRHVLKTSLVLEGLHRHSSTHAAGIVIANQTLTNIVPVCKDQNSDMLIVQYSMKYSEAAGLVKFDFLGLQTLTVITKTIDLLKIRGIDLDINTIPYDDKKTFEMLSKGLATGVFQFESAGMKSALRKLEPDNINDIIALGALYRPGPMDNIPTYIKCKHGQEKPNYLHPLLEPILRATYGVIIYQEQVMEIARKLSGYSLGAADLLRRAMGKKVKSEMDAQEEIFVSGAVKNNVKADQAKSIFATVAKFAGYGFNKSHASTYGIISYQTAYLKANYPVEFLVACLNLDINNSDKINIFLHEARNLDIEIISPDINKSNGLFSIHDEGEKKSIVFALGAIKNVTSMFGLEVEKIRNKHGNFKSVVDFIEKIDAKLINKRLLENIIKSGCFDSLHSNRNSLLKSIPKLMSYGLSYREERSSNQYSLISVDTVSENILVETTPSPQGELAFDEFDVLGLFLKNHPLAGLIDSLVKCNIKNSAYINNELNEGETKVKLAGVITKKDTRMSPRGRFVTLILSDPNGILEVNVFNDDIFEKCAELISIRQSVVVECNILKDKGGIKITALNFTSVEKELQSIVHDISLYPTDKNELEKAVNILTKNINPEKNNSKITIYLPINNSYIAKVNLPDCVFLSENELNLLNSEK